MRRAAGVVCAAMLFTFLASPLPASVVFFCDEDSDSIRTANLDGTDVTTVVSELYMPRGVAIDPVTGKVYWTDAGPVPRVVQRANFDGTGVETLVEEPSREATYNTMALDLTNGKMYFGDSWRGLVKRANLDGTDLETIATGVDAPLGIAVDPINEKVWWSGGSKTQYANLDGTGITDVFSFGARDLELDLTGGKIYIGGHGQTIQRANLDGTGLETLIDTVGFSQMGIDLSAGKLYWSDITLGAIKRANLDGTSIENVITSGLSLPRDIAIFNPSPVPEPASLAVWSILGIVGVVLTCRRRRSS